MDICILTPSYQQPETLAACISSVRDQASSPNGVKVHHHVQDADSGKETESILVEAKQVQTTVDQSHYLFTHTIEKDNGMYDALNRAYAKCDAPIIGHLNCDEQYLPGTLRKVIDWFEAHPQHDVLFGGTIIVRPDGSYLCSRMPVIPSPLHIRVRHLESLTGAMFYRRRLIERLGTYFDAKFKAIGDADLVLRMHEAGVSMGLYKDHLSTFIHSGNNLNQSPTASREQAKLRETAPLAFRHASPLLSLWHRMHKYMSGAYRLQPFDYVFLHNSTERIHHHVDKPTGVWQDKP